MVVVQISPFDMLALEICSETVPFTNLINHVFHSL